MDSIIHIVVGAAVGEAFYGKRLGWKAHILGAFIATFPDFDILVNFFTDNEVIKLLAHRSYTHSWIIQLLYAFPLVWLTFRIFKRKIPLKNLYIFWIFGLFLHSFMDLGTTYGIQLLLPFTDHLFAFNNIAVVDPLFTLPFLFLPLIYLFFKRENDVRRKLTKFAFVYAICYLMLCTTFKYISHQKLEKELARQNIKYDYLSTSPSMFTNLLWSGIAVSKDSIFVSEYSFFQQKNQLPFVHFAKNYNVSKTFKSKELDTLDWFSQDKFIVEKKQDTLKYYVVKWGRMNFEETQLDKVFGFHYELIKLKNTVELKPVEPKLTINEFKKFFSNLWNRVFCY